MPSHSRIPTSAEVWAVIRARHHDDLCVFSKISDADGKAFGGAGLIGKVTTEYGLTRSDFPLIGACTTWKIDHEQPHRHIDERTEYWLCAAAVDMPVAPESTP